MCIGIEVLKKEKYMTKEEIINQLTMDYEEYLWQMNEEEIQTIHRNNVFTIREARRQEKGENILK